MYIISEKKLKKKVFEQGFENIKHFAQKNKLNRNTIHAYLRGQSIFTRQFIRIAEALNCDPLDLIDAMKLQQEISIPANIINTVQYVKDNSPLVAVFLFGSRLTDNNHPYADWDLGFTHARKSLTSSQFFRLKNILEPVTDNFPEQIDFINLDNAPDWFLKNMAHRPVFIGGNELAKIRFLKKWEKSNE